jgi:hypothetical protein
VPKRAVGYGVTGIRGGGFDRGGGNGSGHGVGGGGSYLDISAFDTTLPGNETTGNGEVTITVETNLPEPGSLVVFVGKLGKLAPRRRSRGPN